MNFLEAFATITAVTIMFVLLWVGVQAWDEEADIRRAQIEKHVAMLDPALRETLGR